MNGNIQFKIYDLLDFIFLCLLSGSRLVSPFTSGVTRRQSCGYFIYCNGIFTPHTSYLKESNLLKGEIEYKIDEEVFWTDSTVVLGYIANNSKSFHVFVANRVQKI